jgi:glycosyltransferase involved in cell wall biosynthesis
MEPNGRINPWASFCMSTYKRPDFLEIQIRSLLKQTFTDFEIVISDNDPEGSGKKAIAVFDDSRISYEVNRENLGMVKSFNHSLSKARGEFVIMITDDDPVYNDMLETLHSLYVKYPGYGVYHGGCELLCYTPFTAKVLRAKVGINSCLSSELNYNEEKIYTAHEFPYVYFRNQLGSYLLWSVGAVRREILIETGGMPDYGTEYMTDQAYTAVNCSHSGVVYINRSLGYQAIHGDNFGFSQVKSFEKYESLPDSFTKWVETHMQKRADWPQLKSLMYSYTGRAIVEFTFFIKKSLAEKKINDDGFKRALKYVFKKPYLRKWRYKYILLSKFPATFSYLLQLKQKFRN